MIKRKFAGCSFITCAVLFYLSCGNYSVDRSDRDLLSIERIWQHCKVFSIYQENIPSKTEAFSMGSPVDLLNSLKDTLKSPWKDDIDTLANYFSEYDISILFSKLVSGEVESVIKSSNFTFIDSNVLFTRLTDNTAYLRINEFTSRLSRELLSINDSSLENCTNLIIDLTYNPGGNLDTTEKCIGHFLPPHEPYMLFTHRLNFLDDNINDTGTIEYDTMFSIETDRSLWKNKNIAILINNWTASAAEILATALKEVLGGNAVIMGRTSYGKALGQYIFGFTRTGEGGISLTGFKFYRLDKSSYNGLGIEPDIFLDTSAGNFIKEWLLSAGEYLEPGFQESVNDSLLNSLILILKRNNSLLGIFSGSGNPDNILYNISCAKFIQEDGSPLF